MGERWLGVVVGSDKVIAVDAEVPDKGSITILSDQTWKLQQGPRADAYHVMHQHLSGYARENHIERAIVKASAVGREKVKLGHMEAAELRGVALAAFSSVTHAEAVLKATISKTFGKRKVDEYLVDDDFWDGEISGKKLRKGSREAAIILLSRPRCSGDVQG